MKFSWTSLKISIAGAKLSHLVQKDRIWDHGSMAEQARIIFYLVQKANVNGNIESLKMQCSANCFRKLKAIMYHNDRYNEVFLNEPVIKKLAVVDVNPGNRNKPDSFTALIKGISKNLNNSDEKEFYTYWFFLREGDWWLLDKIKR